MHNRFSYNPTPYPTTYSFNGMERDDEVKGLGNSYDFGARMYDSRVGRWISCDVRESEVPFFTPYRFGFDNPLRYSDIKGEFEIEESTAKSYPNFTAYLKNLSVTYANKPTEFKKAFKQYSELSDSQINKLLEFKIVSDGTKVIENQANPRVKIEELTGANGMTPHFLNTSDPLNIKAKTVGSIILNKSMVDSYEFYQSNESTLLLESTIFHELTHYGDALNGKLSQTTVSCINNKVEITSETSILGSEGGKKFEIAVYGGDINRNNCKKFVDKILVEKYGVKGQGSQPSISTKVNNIIKMDK